MRCPPNRWNYPVFIPPARRHGSGVRRSLKRPLPRAVHPMHAMEKSMLMLGGAGALLLVYAFCALWRAVIER